MNSLYTDEVEKIMYYFKSRLPADFPLVTEEREYFIVIVVDSNKFDYRTVEDRLAIAVTLEELRKAVEETGIRCVIEK